MTGVQLLQFFGALYWSRRHIYKDDSLSLNLLWDKIMFLASLWLSATPVVICLRVFQRCCPLTCKDIGQPCCILSFSFLFFFLPFFSPRFRGYIIFSLVALVFFVSSLSHYSFVLNTRSIFMHVT